MLSLQLLRDTDLGDATLVPDRRKRKRKPVITPCLEDFWISHAEELSRACDAHPHSLAEIFGFIFKQKRLKLAVQLTVQQLRTALLSERCYFHFKETYQPITIPPPAFYKVMHGTNAEAECCSCHMSQANVCCESASCLLPHVLYYQPEAHVVDRIDNNEISPDLFLIELFEDESFLSI